MIRLDQSNYGTLTKAGNSDPGFEPMPGNGVCTRLGDKWTVQVAWHLSRAPERRLRFSAIKQALDGITQRMLTLTLRNLERDGLLIRHYFPEVPPRVEYQLTEMGMEMLAALESVNTWVRESMPHIEESRRVYDLARR